MEAISPGPRPPTVPWRGLLLLWAVALILASTGLGNLPLRDWDEGIVARVSLEIADRGLPRGLLPTLWGDPYLNKPPGLHLLIAATISLWRQASSAAAAAGLPPEWVVRLAPALLSTLVVPLVGLVQCQLRPGQRGAALATAAVMLTLLPVARHGRLAMLDGPQLSAMALLWWALLRSRSSGHSALREGGMAGLAGSALLLLKAPVLLPALAAGLIGLAADPSPGRRRWGQLLIGLVLGMGPGLAWHLWHGWSRGGAALWLWGGDGVTRVLLDAGEGSELGWRVPLIELLEGGWPWLPLWPMALVIAWRQRSMPWGRWCLVLQLVLAASILPLRTQLPWYSHPLWLPFALLCGPLLARLLQPRQDRTPLRFVPILWSVLGGGLIVLALLAATGRTGLPGEASRLVLPAGLGLLVGGLMLLRPTARQRRSGLALLLAGWCFSLLLLFQSSLWNWELNEQDDVRPLASLARAAETGANTGLLPIYVAGQSGRRPSLNWYAQRPIDPLPSRASSGTPTPFLLLAKASTPPPPCFWSLVPTAA